MKRLRVLSVAILLSACGGASKKVEAPTLTQVDAVALGRMVQGVEAAKAPDGRGRAIALLKESIAKNPDLWEAHYNLGILLAQSDSLGEAETELAKAAELAPNAEDVAVALAEVRRRRGEPGTAADGLLPFVRAFPAALTARTALVGVLEESDRLDEAVAQAREVVKRNPSDPDALSLLALAHLARGDMDTAELLSGEALKAEKKTAVAERTAGLVALKRGDDAIAFQHFARASEIDPKDTTARINVGVVLLQAGIYPRAEKEFRAVLAVESDNDAATLGLAAALRGQGKRDQKAPYLEAEKLLKGLVDRRPDYLEAVFNLAVLYGDFLGRPADAKELYQRFLNDAPSKHPARAAAEKSLADLKTGQAGAADKASTAAPGGK